MNSYACQCLISLQIYNIFINYFFLFSKNITFACEFLFLQKKNGIKNNKTIKQMGSISFLWSMP